MTIRIPVVFGLFAALLPLVGAVESKKAARPNVIFVLCDDLGPGDVGALWQNGRKGKQKFTTPNMDQFAKEGMILSRHYCPAPSCMASRSSLMTGRHQGHCARRNTQFDAEIPDVHTLGSVMSKAGYATAAIGKWGMAGGPHQLSIKPVRGDRSPKTNPSHPTLRGFDYFYGYTAHRDAHYHYPKLGNRPFYDGFVDVTDHLAKCYSTDLLTARAKKWIVDHHKAHPKQPFFTYLCYTAPHAGLRIPTTSHLTAKGNYPPGGGLSGGVQWLDDATNGQINTAKGAIDKGMHPEVAHAVGDDGQPWPDHARRHATMVRRIDDALADLIQLLRDLEIDERTLVVLTSDNGTLREGGLDNVGSYRPDYLDTFGRYDGTKLDLWEGGVRMPTIVRWPSVIKAGSKSDLASQFHDWMATFCDLSGVPVPAVSDGVSIVPTLTGKGEQAQGIVYTELLVRGRTQNYLEFEPSRRGRPHGQMQSVLIGDYKGIRVDVKGHQDAFEVYHTLKDPKETTNLAGQSEAPKQKQFQAAVLRSRRIDPLSKRPYDNALIPPVTGITTRPGLVRKEFPGQFDWVPLFGNRTPTGRKIVKGLAVTTGAQQFIGYLRVPKSGVYHFALSTNGKAVARLHDALLIDADSQYKAGAKALSGKIALRAGLHPLRINCLVPDNAPGLSLEWEAPGGEMKPIPHAQFCMEGRLAQQPVPETNQKKPNVVVLFIDDLGWKDLGVYGSKFFETPRIDRLAKQGAMFTRAYSSCNVCSPTRASLLTGKYPQRIGFTSWLNPRKPNGPNSAATYIPATETTIGEAFQKAGYRTGYIGKWHVGSEKVGMPKQHGFDWQMATAKHGLPGSFFHPYKKKGLPSADVPDMEDGKPGDYLTDVLTDKGIGFIRETAKKGKKPFFLILGHYAVHTPIQAPRKLVEKYQAKKQRMYGDTPLKMIPERFNRKVPGRQQNPVYAGMMENLDTNVGKVIDALDELGLTKDTIIVFTSDNGGSCMPGTPTKRPTSNYPLRASKGWNYEGGIRIPTFITWAGKIPAMKTDEPVITMDLYPTLLELTGCKQLPKQTVDGRSLVSLIHGKTKTLDRPFLAWWYPHANGHGTQPCQTILQDGWKLVHWMNQNQTELYRLDDDVGERNDLAKKEPKKTRELLETLNQWVKETARK